ncbi:hypothetical protein V7070_10105, partial [Bacillus safensis]
NSDEQYVVDVLVKHLYKKKSRYKATLWECFGETILNNLKRNLKTFKGCVKCGQMYKPTSNNSSFCSKCSVAIEKEKHRKRQKSYTSRTKMTV